MRTTLFLSAALAALTHVHQASAITITSTELDQTYAELDQTFAELSSDVAAYAQTSEAIWPNTMEDLLKFLKGGGEWIELDWARWRWAEVIRDKILRLGDENPDELVEPFTANTLPRVEHQLVWPLKTYKRLWSTFKDDDSWYMLKDNFYVQRFG